MVLNEKSQNKFNHSKSIENELEKVTNQFVKNVNIENFSYK